VKAPVRNDSRVSASTTNWTTPSGNHPRAAWQSAASCAMVMLLRCRQVPLPTMRASVAITWAGAEPRKQASALPDFDVMNRNPVGVLGAVDEAGFLESP